MRRDLILSQDFSPAYAGIEMTSRELNRGSSKKLNLNINILSAKNHLSFYRQQVSFLSKEKDFPEEMPLEERGLIFRDLSFQRITAILKVAPTKKILDFSLWSK